MTMDPKSQVLSCSFFCRQSGSNSSNVYPKVTADFPKNYASSTGGCNTI
jgi:hypothetical protein